MEALVGKDMLVINDEGKLHKTTVSQILHYGDSETSMPIVKVSYATELFSDTDTSDVSKVYAELAHQEAYNACDWIRKTDDITHRLQDRPHRFCGHVDCWTYMVEKKGLQLDTLVCRDQSILNTICVKGYLDVLALLCLCFPITIEHVRHINYIMIQNASNTRNFQIVFFLVKKFDFTKEDVLNIFRHTNLCHHIANYGLFLFAKYLIEKYDLTREEIELDMLVCHAAESATLEMFQYFWKKFDCTEEDIFKKHSYGKTVWISSANNECRDILKFLMTTYDL